MVYINEASVVVLKLCMVEYISGGIYLLCLGVVVFFAWVFFFFNDWLLGGAYSD